MSNKNVGKKSWKWWSLRSWSLRWGVQTPPNALCLWSRGVPHGGKKHSPNQLEAMVPQWRQHIARRALPCLPPGAYPPMLTPMHPPRASSPCIPPMHTPHAYQAAYDGPLECEIVRIRAPRAAHMPCAMSGIGDLRLLFASADNI